MNCTVGPSALLLILCTLLPTALPVGGQSAYPGYLFFSNAKSASLYDASRKLIHTWKCSYNVAGAAHLLRDSSVIFSALNPNGWEGGALQGGQFQRVTWKGDIIWDFNYASPTYCPHHNIEIVYRTDDPAETPTVLAACYEKVSESPMNLDKVIEIRPNGKTGGDIIWEWRAWAHRTSDGTDRPEQLRESASTKVLNDWVHLNNISYNPKLDQLVLGFKHFQEFLIIDHSTTTAEAATTTGGKYGKGGSVLYRWGHASNYGISGSDFIKNSVHASCWIPDTLPGTQTAMPGAGNVLVFLNSQKQVIEVTPPGSGDGRYPRDAGKAFGPAAPRWSYNQNVSVPFSEGSAQRLPNGNTLICNWGKIVYEVTSDGKKLWEMSCAANQAHMYAPSYLDMKKPTAVTHPRMRHLSAVRFRSSVDRNTGLFSADFEQADPSAVIELYTIGGKTLLVTAWHRQRFTHPMNGWPCGLYVSRITVDGRSVTGYFSVVR